MKRLLLLVTVALMLAAAMALSGVAQAAQGGNKANAQCKAEAVRTLQPGFKPSDYDFVGGTEVDDDFIDPATDGPDVFCGFGGDERIGNLPAGDIFLGGAGNDEVLLFNLGTFYGGEGDDFVDANYKGATFNGGDGTDSVGTNEGTLVDVP